MTGAREKGPHRSLTLWLQMALLAATLPEVQAILPKGSLQYVAAVVAVGTIWRRVFSENPPIRRSRSKSRSAHLPRDVADQPRQRPAPGWDADDLYLDDDEAQEDPEKDRR